MYICVYIYIYIYIYIICRYILYTVEAYNISISNNLIDQRSFVCT